MGLAKYGILASIANKFSTHSSKNDQEVEEPDIAEDDNEIVDALNGNEGVEDGNHDQNVEEEDDEDKDNGRKGSDEVDHNDEVSKDVTPPVLVFSLPNELDADVKIMSWDDKEEEEVKKRDDSEIHHLKESLKSSDEVRLQHDVEKDSVEEEEEEEEDSQPRRKSPYDIAFGTGANKDDEDSLKKISTEKKQKEAEMIDELNDL